MSIDDQVPGTPEAGAAAAFCPGCGSSFGTDDKFCAACGRQRTTVAPAVAVAPSVAPAAVAGIGDAGESHTVVSAAVPVGQISDAPAHVEPSASIEVPPVAQAHEVPALEADASEGGAASDETGEATDDSDATATPRRSRKRLVIVSVAAATALGLLLGGAGLVQHQKEQARLVAIAQSEQQQRDQAATDSATFLDARLAELGTATSTAAVRSVATTAATHKKAAEAYTLTDDRTAKASAAIDSIAALSSLSGDTLGTWPQLRAGVESKLQAVAPGTLRADSAVALAHVDALVASGEKALADWQMQVAVVQRLHSESIAAVNQYNAQAQAQISRYNQLRNEAADWMTRARSAGTYRYSSAVSYFEMATSERRAVRDALAALTVPSELRGQHNELLAVLTEAVDGIQNMVMGLEQNERCYRTSCYLDETPGYLEYDRKSDAITKRYGQAVDSLNYSINELTSVSPQLPAKPEV